MVITIKKSVFRKNKIVFWPPFLRSFLLIITRKILVLLDNLSKKKNEKKKKKRRINVREKDVERRRGNKMFSYVTMEIFARQK